MIPWLPIFWVLFLLEPLLRCSLFCLLRFCLFKLCLYTVCFCFSSDHCPRLTFVAYTPQHCASEGYFRTFFYLLYCYTNYKYMVYQLAMGLIVEVELELGSNVVLIWGVVLAVTPLQTSLQSCILVLAHQSTVSSGNSKSLLALLVVMTCWEQDLIVELPFGG